MHTFTHAHIHTFTHAHIHTYSHTHVHTYTHTRIYAWEAVCERAVLPWLAALREQALVNAQHTLCSPNVRRLGHTFWEATNREPHNPRRATFGASTAARQSCREKRQSWIPADLTRPKSSARRGSFDRDGFGGRSSRALDHLRTLIC